MRGVGVAWDTEGRSSGFRWACSWVRISALFALSWSGSAVADPLVIAHRGASGYLPDHTMAAYRLAVEQGADVIEPDLVATRDGVLVARHENEIGGTTDVAEKFPERRTTKTVDGEVLTGWFTEDFTFAELKTLRARQPLADRPQEHNGRYPVPSLEEILAALPELSRLAGRPIAVEPELKHPSYFRSIDLPLEEPLVAALEAVGFREATAPVYVQCFEADTLRRLDRLTDVRLLLLIARADTPWLTEAGMARLKAFADGLGVHKEHLIPQVDGRWQAPNAVVERAHRAGLLVHVYTFRNEARYLSKDDAGDPRAELRRFMALGVDGLFTDFPDTAIAARSP